MFFRIAPPTATGLALKPVAQASRTVAAVAAVTAATAARQALADERLTRPLTPLAMSLHLMRVPASRLADAYAELKAIDAQDGGDRDGAAPGRAARPPLHLRA